MTESTSDPPDAGLWKRGRHTDRLIVRPMRRMFREVLRNRRVLMAVIKMAIAILQLMRLVSELFRAS